MNSMINNFIWNYYFLPIVMNIIIPSAKIVKIENGHIVWRKNPRMNLPLFRISNNIIFMNDGLDILFINLIWKRASINMPCTIS